MEKHVTIREFVAVLSELDQDALIVMASGWVHPTIQKITTRHNERRYILAPADRLGDEHGNVLLPDASE